MNKIEYKEITAFHPGYYIADIIADMDISYEEFAVQLGTTGKALSRLVNGQCNLTEEFAQKLAGMLGTSADVWMNLQTAYNQKRLEIERRQREEQEKFAAMPNYS